MRRYSRLFFRQMSVQFRVRTFNLYSAMLFFLQPAIFSGIGMVLSRVAGNAKPDLVYTVIGGGLLGMWSGLVFTSTFDVRRDRRDGTLELIVGSPTSLGVVEAIRTFANVIAGLSSMTAALIVAIFIFDYSLNQVNILGASVSLILLLFGMWSIGVFLANFMVWSRLSSSMVEFLEIPIPIVCGFMYPISILPNWMQATSAIFPVRWALEAFQTALFGVQSMAVYWRPWGLTFILSLMFWEASRRLEEKVHDRIRVTGEMSSI